MHWFKKHLGNVGIASICMLFLLTCLALIPLSAVSAHEGTATPTTVTVQATPTEDATMTALNKEKLAQEVLQLKNQNEPDFFGKLQANATLLSTLLVVIGGLIGLWRWFADRRGDPAPSLWSSESFGYTIPEGETGVCKRHKRPTQPNLSERRCA